MGGLCLAVSVLYSAATDQTNQERVFVFEGGCDARFARPDDERECDAALESECIVMEHIAPVSGGLDSSIMLLFLTGYLKGGIRADVTPVFTDPGKEHPNTYAMLDTLEQMTGKRVIRVQGPTWEQALEAHNWFLPFHKARWCTYAFKIQPFEAYVKGFPVTSYIGLRADEAERTGYLGDKGTAVQPRYILREMGMTRADVEAEAQRIGLPPTGLWSCGCCPFKTHFLQVKMIEEQPAMAEWMAWVEAEKQRRGGSGYTWIRGYTMRQLIDNYLIRGEIKRRWWSKHSSAAQISFLSNEPEEQPCLMCRVK